VQLKEIVTPEAGEGQAKSSEIFMVFEYADHDLAGLIQSRELHSTEFTQMQV